MESSCFRYGRDEESVGCAGHTDFEYQHPVRGLMDFLDPAARKMRSDLCEDFSDFECAESHRRCRLKSVKGISFRERNNIT